MKLLTIIAGVVVWGVFLLPVWPLALLFLVLLPPLWRASGFMQYPGNGNQQIIHRKRLGQHYTAYLF